MPEKQKKALQRVAKKKFPGKSKEAKKKRDRFTYGTMENQKKKKKKG
jgi:hypothetical protein